MRLRLEEWPLITCMSNLTPISRTYIHAFCHGYFHHGLCMHWVISHHCMIKYLLPPNMFCRVQFASRMLFPSHYRAVLYHVLRDQFFARLQFVTLAVQWILLLTPFTSICDHMVVSRNDTFQSLSFSFLLGQNANTAFVSGWPWERPCLTFTCTRTKGDQMKTLVTLTVIQITDLRLQHKLIYSVDL